MRHHLALVASNTRNAQLLKVKFFLGRKPLKLIHVSLPLPSLEVYEIKIQPKKLMGPFQSYLLLRFQICYD